MVARRATAATAASGRRTARTRTGPATPDAPLGESHLPAQGVSLISPFRTSCQHSALSGYRAVGVRRISLTTRSFWKVGSQSETSSYLEAHCTGRRVRGRPGPRAQPRAGRRADRRPAGPATAHGPADSAAADRRRLRAVGAGPPAQLHALRALGITRGISMRALPIAGALATPAAIRALATPPTCCAIHPNARSSTSTRRRGSSPASTSLQAIPTRLHRRRRHRDGQRLRHRRAPTTTSRSAAHVVQNVQALTNLRSLANLPAGRPMLEDQPQHRHQLRPRHALRRHRRRQRRAVRRPVPRRGAPAPSWSATAPAR